MHFRLSGMQELSAHRGFLKKARNNRSQNSGEAPELHISGTLFILIADDRFIKEGGSLKS